MSQLLKHANEKQQNTINTYDCLVLEWDSIKKRKL